MKYTIEVTEAQVAGLEAVAKKDGLTVEELVQKQMDYYLGVVIKQYVDVPVELTETQKKELDALLATTKAAYIAEITVVKKQ